MGGYGSNGGNGVGGKGVNGGLSGKVQCLEENKVTETDGQLTEVWVDMVATAVTMVTVEYSEQRRG